MPVCFYRTLKLAFSFGGDTDTIGSMAGALAGAHYGVGAVTELRGKVASRCEGTGEASEQGHDLYKMCADRMEKMKRDPCGQK